MLNRETLKSIMYVLLPDNISKSIVSDLMYSSDMKIEKIGSELREKIKEEFVELVTKKSIILNSLPIMVNQIQESPKAVVDDYSFRGMKSKIASVPLKYAYDQIYPSQSSNDCCVAKEGSEQTTVATDKPSLMRTYNQKVSEYIDVCVDCLYTKTALDNIDDKKKYLLSLQLATQLGF